MSQSQAPSPRAVITYHKISRSIETSGGWIPPGRFYIQMKYLKAKGIPVLTPDEFISGKNGVLLTFDDGYQDIYRYVLPVMLDFAFPAVVGIITDFIGKYNAWDVGFGRKKRHLSKKEILELKRHNFFFASHSHIHPDLTLISEKQVKDELKTSKKILEDILGDEAKYIIYPFGRVNKRVRDIAEEVGYKAGFHSTPIDFQDIMRIPRWGIYVIDFIPQFRLKMYQTPKFLAGIESIKCRFINSFASLTYPTKHLYQMLKS